MAVETSGLKISSIESLGQTPGGWAVEAKDLSPVYVLDVEFEPPPDLGSRQSQ